MRQHAAFLVAIVFFASALTPAALAVAPEAPVQQQREPARTMSYRGAPWLERVERVATERPEEVLDAMGLEPGDVVADIGVGSGYFARRIARRVGPDGKVYGVDIQPEMLDILRERARQEGIDNIEPVLGEPDDPKLPPGAIDWMILVDVYHEISEPAVMLARMRQALAPDGRIALLEYRLEDRTADHIFADHRMSIRQVLAEWKAAGFELVELHEFLPSQHMFVFRGTRQGEETGSTSSPALQDYDLFAAIDAGLVEVEARGADREQVRLRIRRRVDGRMVITAPAGTLFQARGESRDMVARRDAGILLSEDGWTDWAVRAIGTRSDRPAPGGRERFDLKPAADNAVLGRVAMAIQAGTYYATREAARSSYVPPSIGVEEAAVWIAEQDPAYDDIAGQIGDERVPAPHAAALALALCDRAGIDITQTRMWRDREAIFQQLDVPELTAWYASRIR